jgi:hypothetical protein
MTAKSQANIIDRAEEAICLGPFNVTIDGPISTLTFTHVRQVFGGAGGETETVVKARIVISTNNLIELRDVVSGLLEQIEQPSTTPNRGGTLN